MKILIRGYYGFGNFGDDILMITTFKMMRERHSDATFYIFSNFNHNLRQFSRNNGYNHYIHTLLPEKPELIDWTFQGKFDLLIDGGGGVYFGTKSGSWLQKLRNGLLRAAGIKPVASIDKFLRRLAFRPRRLRFNKRVGIGLGIGPYPQGSPQLYAHLAEIGSYDALAVRDASSINFLEEFGFPGSRYLGTDIAFLSRYWLPDGFTFPDTKRFTRRVGIVLMDWPEQNRELFSEFRKFAEESALRGYDITFFSLDENHDKEYVKFFAGLDRFIVWQPDQMDMTMFLRSLGALDIIITARAHGAIVAGQLGVVPVCLGKSQKLVEVHNMFPGSSLLIREPFSRKILHNAVEEIGGNYEMFLKRLRVDNERNRIKAERNILALTQWI